MNAPNELESAVLDRLLAGRHPALEVLRVQRERLLVSKREFTGVGFFTEFSHPPDVVRLQAPTHARFGDVLAERSPEAPSSPPRPARSPRTRARVPLVADACGTLANRRTMQSRLLSARRGRVGEAVVVGVVMHFATAASSRSQEGRSARGAQHAPLPAT